MMARAKHLGRQFAAGACAEDALTQIRTRKEDAATHFVEEDDERELILLDKVTKAMTNALRISSAFTLLKEHSLK